MTSREDVSDLLTLFRDVCVHECVSKSTSGTVARIISRAISGDRASSYERRLRLLLSDADTLKNPNSRQLL